jgi:hypothetical protein
MFFLLMLSIDLVTVSLSVDVVLSLPLIAKGLLLSAISFLKTFSNEKV